MKKYSLLVLLSLCAFNSFAAEKEAPKGPTGLKGYIETIVSIPGNAVMHIVSGGFEAVGNIINSFAAPWAEAAEGIKGAGNISK